MPGVLTTAHILNHRLAVHTRRRPRLRWLPILWFVLFGLAIWSYGFNNIPLIPPVPIVDVLVIVIVILSLPTWWPLLRVRSVRSLFLWVSMLSLVIALRLLVDVPQYGMLAGRDALFASQAWLLFPAIAAGFYLDYKKLDRKQFWLFSLATVWFLLYPWREQLTPLSPTVGLQRPVPLFAWTTAVFLPVPAFFWFLQQRSAAGIIGVGACLLALLFAQSRGAYLAFLLSSIVAILTSPRSIPRWAKSSIAFLLVILGLSLAPPLPGRLGEPVGLDTVRDQLETLLGRSGPGAGSFRHRLEAWPQVADMVLREPYGWLVGLGLGRDLFLGFSLGPGILVRKPHNDFLEVWARTGIFGLIAYLGLLGTLGLLAFRGARRDPRHLWILALQITMAITSFAQPALGFAYTTVTWVGLTGLWLGAQIRDEYSRARLARSQLLPSARRRRYSF